MQSDAGRNYFELFGLPVSFEVNKSLLTERYRDLQRAVHPDKFANTLIFIKPDSLNCCYFVVSGGKRWMFSLRRVVQAQTRSNEHVSSKSHRNQF